MAMKSLPTVEEAAELSPEELRNTTVLALDQAACRYAQAMYWDEEFQKLAELESLSQEEQDRIFNELICACVVLIMLVFEAPDLDVSEDRRVYFRELSDCMPDVHARQLKDLGVEEEHRELWIQLIRMRHEEYARDRHEVRAAAMDLESKEKDLDEEDLSNIQKIVPVQAVAVGCHHHICRQEVEGRNELFLLVLDKLSQFYVEFRVSTEGGKITRLTRVRTAIRKAWRRRFKTGGR